jgi:hypothetical protein
MPEMDLKGHVDICSVIRGWSLATSDLTQRVEVEFVQGDCVIGSVTPSIPAPKLLEVLKVGETQDFARPFVWQLPYPLALGIKPDTPFSVRFRANARELGGGSGRIIRTVETIDDEAKDDLEHQTFINAHYSRDDKVITGHVVVMGRHLKPEADEPFSILRNGQATNVSFAICQARCSISRSCRQVRHPVRTNGLRRIRTDTCTSPERRDHHGPDIKA